MANDAGAKAYVQSLSLSLHEELKSCGTVLPLASMRKPMLSRYYIQCDLEARLGVAFPYSAPEIDRGTKR